MHSLYGQCCMCRLLYKVNRYYAIQFGLSDAEKLRLDKTSLDDLKLELQRVCLKPQRSHGCSSVFRGVCQSGNRFRAELRTYIGGKTVRVFFQRYDNAEEAARAWDRAALQHRSRYIAPGPGVLMQSWGMGY